MAPCNHVQAALELVKQQNKAVAHLPQNVSSGNLQAMVAVAEARAAAAAAAQATAAAVTAGGGGAAATVPVPLPTGPPLVEKVRASGLCMAVTQAGAARGPRRQRAVLRRSSFEPVLPHQTCAACLACCSCCVPGPAAAPEQVRRRGHCHQRRVLPRHHAGASSQRATGGGCLSLARHRRRRCDGGGGGMPV